MYQLGMTTEGKFWSNINKDGPVCIHPRLGDIGQCWLWTAGKSSGYGLLRESGRTNPIYAHRYSWELHNDRPVPARLNVNHHCDVRACVRPEHLFVGTQLANIRDALDKGRLAPQQETFKRLWREDWKNRRGENIHCSKLTGAQVLEIRKLYAKNIPGIRKGKEYSIERLASMFSVSARSIYDIIDGLTWKHLLPRATPPNETV